MRPQHLLLLLLLIPSAVAGPGHSGGVAAAGQNVPFFVELEGSEVAGGNISIPTTVPAEGVVATMLNKGDHPILVDLFLEEDVLVTWTVPADGVSHDYRHFVAAPGNLSIDFRSPTAPDGAVQTIDVILDWSGGCDYNPLACLTKLLAWEIPGASVVFPAPTTDAGTYQATVPSPPMHTIRVELWDSEMRQRIASVDEQTVDEELMLQWDAEADTTYIVRVESLAVDRSRQVEDGKGTYQTARISLVVDGPLVKATPAPFGWVALALVALAVKKKD